MRTAAQAASADLRVTARTPDAQFVQMVDEALETAFRDFRPDFVIYNAGTDCMEEDPLGALNISPQGIIKRDEVVFRHCYERNKVPVVMVLSGGYLKENAPVIANSIRNLQQVFGLQI